MDPSVTASAKWGLFGLPTKPEAARLHILQVPWDVTTSYGGGASRGPDAILNASPQIDLFDIEYGTAYEAGFYLRPTPGHLRQLNDRLRPLALKVRHELEEKGKLSPEGEALLGEVNRGCEEMTTSVYWEARQVLDAGRHVALIGGDHSTPEGCIRAVSERVKGDFGILHIDAHADLRLAYQGFKHSHASIMRNVMLAPWRPRKLVQVGIRDFCEEEYRFSQEHPDIHVFHDATIKREQFTGSNWSLICRRIIDELPTNVYVSFDIDGLNPALCPHTGTPVPGGLSFDEATFLLNTLLIAKKRIVGFDLNEVAPGDDGDEWDGNVGARLLFKLCGLLIASNSGGAR